MVRIVNKDIEKVVRAFSKERFIIRPKTSLNISIWAKTQTPGQHFTVGVVFYDANEKWIRKQNVDLVGIGDLHWQRWSAVIRQIPAKAKSAEIRVGATEWFKEKTGTTWFADPELTSFDPWRETHGVTVQKSKGVHVWINRAEQQLTPLTTPPTNVAPKNGIDLHSVRNEFETFQIAFRGSDTLMKVQPLDLVSAENTNKIVKSVEVRRVEYVNVKNASDPTSRDGKLADPLQALKLPVKLKNRRTEAVWVSIHVDSKTKPAS